VAVVEQTSHDMDLARVDGDDSGWVSFPWRGSSQEQLLVVMVSSSFLHRRVVLDLFYFQVSSI
jgi:hypothetical protein